MTFLLETQHSFPNSTYEVPLPLCGLQFLETDGLTARRQQLASCRHLLQITRHVLPTGIVTGYGVTAGKLRTIFRTVQISRLRTSSVSLELVSNGLPEWQVIRRTHRREASCHLLATDTWHRFFLRLDSMVEKMLKCQRWTHGGRMCAIRYPCIIYTSKSVKVSAPECYIIRIRA